MQRILLALIAAATFAAAPALAQPARPAGPAAVLQLYLDAVNSGDLDALTNLLSDDIAAYSFRDCTPQMTPKACLATFVNNTMLKRHGSLALVSARVEGDKIIALLEVHHDGTRAARVPRMLGTDTITVKGGKILSFAFKQDPDDRYNKALAAYYVAHPEAR